MMGSYDDLATRQRTRFNIFASAVAGERAMASAAGVKPGSYRTLVRAQAFREAFASDVRNDLSVYWEQHLGEASDDTRARGLGRVASVLIELNSISQQIVTKANREVFEGQPGLVELMRGPKGSLGLLAQRKMAQPTFKVNDSSGRSWTADQLFFVVVRDFAYQTYIDHQFDQALTSGQTSVTTSTDEIIDLTTEDWMARRNEIFHVNSKATLQ